MRTKHTAVILSYLKFGDLIRPVQLGFARTLPHQDQSRLGRRRTILLLAAVAKRETEREEPQLLLWLLSLLLSIIGGGGGGTQNQTSDDFFSSVLLSLCRAGRTAVIFSSTGMEEGERGGTKHENISVLDLASLLGP